MILNKGCRKQQQLDTDLHQQKLNTPVCSEGSRTKLSPLPAACSLYRETDVFEQAMRSKIKTERNCILTISADKQGVRALPMAWMVYAHVFQDITGTYGHRSLGAICRPTLCTVVAQTISISVILRQNLGLVN